MMQSLNVNRAMRLFREAHEPEVEIDAESEEESEEEFDDEVEDPTFAEEEASEDDECPSWPQCRRRSVSTRSRSRSPLARSRSGSPPTRTRSPTTWTRSRSPLARSRSRSPPTRSRSPAAQAAEPRLSSEPWKTEKDADSAPSVCKFHPRRTPGIQIETLSPLSPKELFLLFFANDTVKTICKNTNKNAAKNKELGKKYKWTDVEVEDMYKCFGLLLYMSLVSMPSLVDYWKQNHILSVPIPSKVMSRDRFRTILWNIHLSDPKEDAQNDKKKGTPGYDKLFRVRPLYDDILTACLAYYHPKRELSVDERMVATKAKTGMTQHMMNKPTKCGIKLFVLAESSSGYTLRFSIYTGKTATASDHGLPYDVVMNLIKPSCLGVGYHIYMGNFYTSPKLFTDLASMKLGACGTFRESTKGCPRGRENALTKHSGRGSVRWIREGQLVFVKWMDTREVSVCSTIHPAFSGDIVRRRVKGIDGVWGLREIPCPTPVIAYNRNMGGVDVSDQLIQYYSTHRKTARWYKTLLLHFLDIASTNAYILHREMSRAKQVQPMSHKDFMVELVCQLCDVNKAGIPQNRKTDHVPVPIASPIDPAKKTSKGRLKCQRCLQVDEMRKDTPWKCQGCDVPLCVVVDRNCFFEWHK